MDCKDVEHLACSAICWPLVIDGMIGLQDLRAIENPGYYITLIIHSPLERAAAGLDLSGRQSVRRKAVLSCLGFKHTLTSDDLKSKGASGGKS
jgi:hypothetical protein